MSALEAENSPETAPIRKLRPGEPGAGRPFRKGQPSANPGGRPKDAARLVRERLGGSPVQLVDALLELVENPKTRGADRISAARELWDRGWGKAQGFNPQDLDALGLDEISAEVHAIAEALQKRNV